MSASTKIAVAVASGYLLGRTKKLKLALTVGGLLAGRRVAANPQALMTQWSKLVEKNPELQKLQGQVTGKLVDAAKTAAMTTATQRIEGLHRSLSEGSAPAEDAEVEDDEPAEEEVEPEEKPAPRKTSSGKGGTARKTAASSAKNQPAKKQAAKKSSSSRRSSASSRSGRSASRK